MKNLERRDNKRAQEVQDRVEKQSEIVLSIGINKKKVKKTPVPSKKSLRKNKKLSKIANSKYYRSSKTGESFNPYYYPRFSR